MNFRDVFAPIKRKFTALWMREHFASLFHQVADPVIVLRPEDIICHQVTVYAAYPVEKRPPAIGDYQLEHLLKNEQKTCVYVNHQKKVVVLGHKGTEITSMKDLLSDVEIILGVSGFDRRVALALQNYDHIQAMYPAYEKIICGHSLGGTICYIIAKHREPVRCTVFNPGSSPNPFFIQMLTDTVQKAPWTKRVFTYKIFGDVISSFSFVGNTKVFQVSSVDPYYLHSFVHFAQPGVEYVPLEGVFTLPQKETVILKNTTSP